RRLAFRSHCRPAGGLESPRMPCICVSLRARARTQEQHLNNQWFSKIAVWMVIAMVLFTVFKQFDGRSTAGAGYIGYSEFLDQVKARQIKSATIQEGQGGTEIVAVTQDDRRVRT